MRHTIVLALAFLVSCRTSIREQAIDHPLRDICARHDAYVVADPALDAAAKASALSQSAALIAAIAPGGYIAVDSLEPPATSVCARLDGYVTVDPALDKDPGARKDSLRRTAIFLHLLDVARRAGG